MSQTLRSPNPVARPVLGGPHFPTQEEINAELRRRGLLPVLQLVAQEMERRIAVAVRPKTQLHSRSRTRGTATNKDTNNRSLQDDRIERDLEKSKSRRLYPTTLLSSNRTKSRSRKLLSSERHHL